MFPLPPHILFEAASFLVSIACWRSLSKTWLRWFTPFLLFIMIVELTARYFRYELKQPNAWLFSLSIPVEYSFYAFIFWKGFSSVRLKKVAIGFIALFFLYNIYNIIFITSLKFFDMKILLLGNLTMVIFSIFYFIELYNASDIQPMFKKPSFWIFTGIMLFNAGEFCYNLISVLIKDDRFDATLKIFGSINNSLILVLYSCFIIAFICQRISETSRTA